MGKKPKQPDYVVIVDSREQTPWCFGDDQPVITTKLAAGDYSLERFRDIVAIERKSLDDLCATVITHKKRFARELDRLETYQHKLIVVEANVSDVIDHKYSSKAHPMSVLGACLAIQIYRSIPVCFWGNRQIAQHLAGKWFGQVWKAEMRKEKGETSENVTSVKENPTP